MGIVRFALRFQYTFYVLAALILFLGVVAMLRNADRYLPGNPDPGGDGDLELYRPQHAGDGAARHHLQPVLDQRERQRYQEYRSADA